MAWKRWITSAILIICLACFAVAEVRPNPNARAVHDPRVQAPASMKNNIKAPLEVGEMVTAENVPYPSYGSYRSSYGGGGGYGGGYSPAPPAYYYPMPSYYPPPPPPSYGYGYPGSSSYGSYMPSYSYDYYYPPAYPSYGSSYGGSYGGYAPPYPSYGPSYPSYGSSYGGYGSGYGSYGSSRSYRSPGYAPTPYY